MRQLCNVAYYFLSENRDEEQQADLDDRLWRPLESDRPPTDAERAQMLAGMGLPIQVIRQ